MELRTKGQLSRPHLFETQFPKASDFDEPPTDPYDRSTPFPEPEPVPRPIFNEIVVQPPPALRAYKTYGDFQPDNLPSSMPCDDLTPSSGRTPSAQPTIFASPKSTARTPSSTVEATSSYMSNNPKDSSTSITLMLCSCSTKGYMVSNNHHVYGTYFYQRLL